MYTIKEIEQILLHFDNSSLTELEIRKESTEDFLRLKRTRRNNPKKQNGNNFANPLSEKQIVKSERVGFFSSHTSVGITVEKGEIIGEIIALKTSTSIESPCEGKITKIYPQNGESIEYGQLLFLIETKN